MAFSTIFRRTASSLAPLTIRAIRTQRNHFSTIFTPLKNSSLSQELCRRTFPSTLNFSSLSKKSNSNNNLLKIIDSEIKCAEEEPDNQDQVDKIPDGFPFEIEDEPGKQTISLRRQLQGEVIKVEVHIPELVEGEEDDEEKNDENSETDGQPSIAMVVSVSKGRNEPCLEFECTAYPDEITIDSLSVRDPNTCEDDLAYEGPDFQDLEENLQKAFHNYLEDRGIKPSTTNFLYEYMSNKDSKEYRMWLKNLKRFIEK